MAEVTVEQWRGYQVLRLSGSISNGTAARYRELVSTVDRLPHGLPILLLDSSGGLVDEALALSAIMADYPAHTVIPDGAKCASACASIVFVAGQNRTIEDGGALGQHSCSVGGVADQACNEEIAAHAIKHGVSHGSIAAFVTYVAPDDILWFSREDAEGWGLTRYPGEAESGFEKSEPRVIRMLTGSFPAAQSAWRLAFREDGYQAFSRTVSDVEREMEIGLFCIEALPGRLFLSMTITGPAAAVQGAVAGVGVFADHMRWDDHTPAIWQIEPMLTEVITEVPRERIIEFLTRIDALTFGIAMRKPYEPIIGRTTLSSSRGVLKFAANNCASGTYAEVPSPLR
ncbi:hypothetical protein [Neoaquamicrobium microcysteis]|uniref:hypothetical protein n=1 Tax=Neoaquamicrobium microcysteis TaxID=2682781 RepID=UPI001F43D490|nr:hypothetical protein [Mesorhizobium microcysteis]